MPSRTFNADEKTAELLASEITIGGRQFKPARVTPDVRAESIEIQVANAKLVRDDALDQDGSDTSAVTPEQLERRAQGIKLLDQHLYEQLIVLLRDADTEERPEYDFLVQHLDQRIARELLTWLEEGEQAEGEAEETTTPPATGP